MPTPEYIQSQQELLQMHRRTLAHYLRQQAELGSAYTPPGVTSGIVDARENISRIKGVLKSWNITVEDLPDDVEAKEKSILSNWYNTFAIVMRRLETEWSEERDSEPINISGGKTVLQRGLSNLSILRDELPFTQSEEVTRILGEASMLCVNFNITNYI